jgi:hypothetical protein
MARLRGRPLLLVALAAAAAGGAVAVVLAAQLGNDERSLPPPATRTMRPLPPPAPLVSIRPLDRRICRASRLLRPVCPRRVVSGLYPRRGVYLAPHGGAGERHDRFDLIGLPRRPARARHLVLFASRYGLARSGAGRIFAEWPWQGPVVGLRDGLTRGGRERSVLLARPTWAARGDLVLDRSRPQARFAGDHLVFRWRSRGVDYAVALSAWEPLREAAATLRAIIASASRRGPGGRR